MKYQAIVHLTDSESARGVLELPGGPDSGLAHLAGSLDGAFPFTLESGTTLTIPCGHCDLIELEHSAAARVADQADCLPVAIMLANWQLLIGWVEHAGQEAESTIRGLLLGPARFIELRGSRSHFLVNRDAVLWMVPFLPDAETGMFALTPGGFADPNAPRPDAETVPS